MNTHSHPLVSIVMATYQNESTIRTALESALAQNYPNLEIVVNDDCSRDKTVAIVSEYLTDPRLRLTVNESNLGVYGNFDKCIRKLSRGEFFTMVNGDDAFINPDFVTESMALVQKYAGLNFVKGGSFHAHGAHGKYHTYEQLPDYVQAGEFFKAYDKDMDLGFVGIFFRRDVFNSHHFFEKFRYYGMDYFINFIMVASGGLGLVKKPSYQFNVHASNSNYKAYLPEQAKYFFSELNGVIEAEVLPVVQDQEISKSFYRKNAVKYIQSSLEHYYRFSRKELKSFISLLKSLDADLSNQFLKGKRWKIYQILFYNVKVGTWLMYLKWRLQQLF